MLKKIIILFSLLLVISACGNSDEEKKLDKIEKGVIIEQHDDLNTSVGVLGESGSLTIEGGFNN